MTASADRRRRHTTVAAAMAAVGVVLAVVITVVGASTLADSRAGRDVTAGGGVPQVSMPATATALLAVVDDDGRLTSAAAMVLSPEGVGGSLVVVPATADSVYGRIGDVHPLAETLAIAGAERFLADAESLLAVTFDIAEVVDVERVVDLFGSALDVEVVVPGDLPDEVAADLPAEFTGGSEPVTLPLAEAAALLTLTRVDAPTPDEVAEEVDRLDDVDGDADDRAVASVDHLLEPLRAAVWRGIADAAAGTRSAEPLGDDAPQFRPDSLDVFVDRLLSGPTGVRDLRHTAADRDQNPRGADAVLLDRPEVLLVFGQIAPGRVAAPNDSLTFRVESRFSAEQLAPYGINNADVARDVIQILLFLRANVVSVETSTSGAPAVTDASVADPLLIEQVEEGWEVVFGEVTVEPADAQLAGVDATVILGESYLERRDADLRRLGEGATDD